MESYLEEAVMHAERLFGDGPTFLFGSRANGNHNPKSDWDICVIGDRHTFREVGKNIDITCINKNKIAQQVATNVHGYTACAFAKGIIPIKEEKKVISVENYVKLNIANYVAKKTNSSSKDLTGKDVVIHYFSEEAKYNPAFKPRLLKFFDSKDTFKAVVKQYDKILEENDLPLPATYGSISYLNTAYKFTVKNMMGIIKKPMLTLKIYKRMIADYPKCALVDLKEYAKS
jgi:predicted nucleotidyltransferase